MSPTPCLSSYSFSVILLSIDPSLRSTGFGILAKAGRSISAVEFGIIKNPPTMTQSGCLLRIFEVVSDLIDRHQPDLCAIESVIYVQSYRTAITLGAARGSAMLAAARAGIPIQEFAPRRVKQAVVGKGGAQKNQVAFMIRTMLGLKENPPPDAADALAIGLACFQNLDTNKAIGVIAEKI